MDEKKVIHAYIVKEFEDGNFDVEDAGIEGTETLDKEQIYQSVTLLADLIDKTRMSNLVKVNVYRAMAQFFQDRAGSEMVADSEPETPNNDLIV